MADLGEVRIKNETGEELVFTIDDRGESLEIIVTKPVEQPDPDDVLRQYGLIPPRS